MLHAWDHNVRHTVIMPKSKLLACSLALTMSPQHVSSTSAAVATAQWWLTMAGADIAACHLTIPSGMPSNPIGTALQI
jgi:hypothetical protein